MKKIKVKKMERLDLKTGMTKAQLKYLKGGGRVSESTAQVD